MPKLLVTARVKDPVTWEDGFRTHGDHFRSMSVSTPISFAVNGNEVAVCFEPTDVATFTEAMDTPANIEAMEHDGVIRDTVKVYVMDKEFRP